MMTTVFHHKDKNYQVYVKATCACGKQWIVRKTSVDTRKVTKCASCACHIAQLKHGERVNRTPTYITWRSMTNRCLYPKSSNWRYYGGKGITVCPRWRTFVNFKEDMGERPVGKTLDRINPDGNYIKINCRWATAKEQRANRH